MENIVICNICMSSSVLPWYEFTLVQEGKEMHRISHLAELASLCRIVFGVHRHFKPSTMVRAHFELQVACLRHIIDVPVH